MSKYTSIPSNYDFVLNKNGIVKEVSTTYILPSTCSEKNPRHHQKTHEPYVIRKVIKLVCSNTR